MALVIAGDRSGVGKTTITLALLSFLFQQRGNLQSFKVGPDYIDPMFHTAVTGRPCRNLDPMLTSEAYVPECFARHCHGVDYALVEGVMGLFDGVSGAGGQRDKGTRGQGECSHHIKDFASTAHVARLLDLPVLLVLDSSRLSGSIAAIAHGYCSFDPKVKIAGVVLNRVGNDRHLQLLQDALEPLNLPVLGVLRRQDDVTIPDRHLGLVPTAEIEQLDGIFAQLAELAKNCFDWERLLPLLEVSQKTEGTGAGEAGEAAEAGEENLNASTCNLSSLLTPHSPIRIAIARDRAFSFYYQDNLDILQQLGAQLIPWSPIQDERLPDNIQGLYLGGGFPEVFAQQLADNRNALQAVRSALQAGMPTYAECGGLMYLCEQMIDFTGQSWQMAGVVPTTAVMGKRLTLGYRQATALRDSPLLNTGEIIWGHEFHRSQLTSAPVSPLFEIAGGKQSYPLSEGWQSHQLHASYIHLHWGAHPEIPTRFLRHCFNFGQSPR
ncbi:MAG: cobyrinic acid a,c-diamide synthase [Cyanobacteria bacterium QH_8_48_120]|nr:MAG: cobyrinic acid a,c-diamide synthase [Cyanobacteria bacterium QH_8_48_120]